MDDWSVVAVLKTSNPSRMKRSRKAGNSKTPDGQSGQDDHSFDEINANSESKVPSPNLSLLSALNAPGSGSVSPSMRILAQMGALPMGARITPGLGFDSSGAASLTGQGSTLWGRQQQDVEQRQQHLLSAQLLLQQQQQEQAYLAAAMASSTGVGSLRPLSNLGGHQLSTLESLLATRAQLQEAHAQLRSQSMLPPGYNLNPTDDQTTALASLLRAEDATARGKRDEKLPSYYDASRLPDPSSDEEHVDEGENHGSVSELTGDASAASQEKFPLKLYRMLDEAEKNGDDNIVSFFPHGRAFAIHKPREFVSELMPKYFSTSRMSSFQRQLNLYGFRRITDGRDKGGYFHEFFLRGRKALCKKIHRKKTVLRAPHDSTEGASLLPVAPTSVPSEGFLDSPFAAASTSALNPAFLAQLNQQNLLQRQNFAASMQLMPQSAASATLNHPLLNVGNSFGGSLFSGLGPSNQNVAMAEAGRLASEMASIERYKSDILRQLQQYQHNLDISNHNSAMKGDRSDDSD